MAETGDERDAEFPRGNNYQEDVAAILLQLKEKFSKISEAIKCFSKVFCRILETDRAHFSHQVKKALVNRSCELDYELRDIFEAKSLFSKALVTFAGKKTMSNSISKDPCFMEPLDIKIDDDPGSIKQKTHQYVPLLPSFRMNLQHENIGSGFAELQHKFFMYYQIVHGWNSCHHK